MKILFSLQHIFKTYHKLRITRTMASLPKVFVRNLDADDKIKINFTYGTESYPEKNYGFVRNKDETLEITISRMKLKISDTIIKKISNKRKKKDPPSKNEQPDTIPVEIALLKDGNNLDLSVKNGDAWNANSKMKINEVTYEIIENPPTVTHLSLPKHIMADFPVYPKVSLDFCSKEECDFTWYKTLSESEKQNRDEDKEIFKIKNEKWLRVCKTSFYVTRKDDVGCRLRVTCLPKCENKVGIEEDAMTVNSIQLGPVKCPFEDRHVFTKEVTQTGRIRCVSYNILADLYADSDTARNELFPYCPTEALTIDYRKQLLLKEIIGYNGDILCLQEVDRKVFQDDLIPVLTTTGLNGLYNEKGGQVVEGLACFYRTTKFKAIETQGIILSEALKSEAVLQPLLSKINENDKLTERIMNRTTALQVVLLESLDMPKKRILIANTHLYWRPDSDNIRLMQAATCLTLLENFMLKYQQLDPSYTISLLLSGDFNSCPEFGVYELMTKGILNADCVDWKSNPEEEVSGLPLRHSFALNSACGTPEYTNYTEGFVGCLDYIFFDQSKMKVCDIVPFPLHQQVVEHRALPNRVFPSDHIALVCTLEWK